MRLYVSIRAPSVRFRWIAEQFIHLSRPEVASVDAHHDPAIGNVYSDFIHSVPAPFDLPSNAGK